MKTAHIFISGMVQGVGFRYFVRSNAKKLGITGWVRNANDGKVEAVVQGLEKDIEELIALCKKGPFLAEVRDVEFRSEEKDEQYTDFEIQ